MGQVMNKLQKGEPTDQQKGKLAADIEGIIDEIYEAKLNKDVNFDDLYYAIFLIIQKLREKKGAMLYKSPPKEDLEKLFSRYHVNSNKALTKEEFKQLITEVIKPENFSVGHGAIDIFLYLFGIPICALMAKKVIPGMRSVSDDVVIPLATSGSVIFLVKTHKL